MTSILLVDDQSLIRLGFRLVLESEDDFTVVGEASDGRAALAQVAALAPDLVLMDVRMPGMDGIEATRRIIDTDPDVRILVLTTFDLDEYAFAALQAGASGFLLKDASPNDLVSAVRSVASGDAVVSPRVTRRMLEMLSSHMPATDSAPLQTCGASHPRLAGLTPRELDVLRLMAEGMSNAELAAHLFLSEATIKTHVGRVLAKLGVRDRVQAVITAYETRLVTPGGTPLA